MRWICSLRPQLGAVGTAVSCRPVGFRGWGGLMRDLALTILVFLMYLLALDDSGTNLSPSNNLVIYPSLPFHPLHSFLIDRTPYLTAKPSSASIACTPMHTVTALSPIVHSRIRTHRARTLGNRRLSDHGAGRTAVTVEKGEGAVGA